MPRVSASELSLSLCSFLKLMNAKQLNVGYMSVYISVYTEWTCNWWPDATNIVVLDLTVGWFACVWIVSAHCHCHFRAVSFLGEKRRDEREWENFSTVAPIQNHSMASFAFWWQSSSSFTLHKPAKMCANNKNKNNKKKTKDSKNAWKKNKIENALWHAIECRWFVFTPNNFFCVVFARNCLLPNVGKCFLLFS